MELLIVGAQGPLVTLLQQRLQAAGYSVSVTGHYTDETARAVIQLQQAHNLVIDGIYGPKSHAALMHQSTQHWLSQSALSQACQALDISAAALNAVRQVESRGQGFTPDGQVSILYERHIMPRRLKANGISPARITKLQQQYPQLVNRQPGGYIGGSAEHYRLKLARSLHSDSALESCSWGLFQIMGYHWQRLGYSSLDSFISAMQTSEDTQLDAFVRFIKADSTLHAALKEHDWHDFARIYNGASYRKNNYHTKLAKAYAAQQEAA